VDAVAAFTTTLDHRRVVEMCAPLHIDVMMEKPLAVNMQEARAIQAAAKSGGIQVIVNYETTWYRANQAAYKLADEEHAIGDLRKIVAHDGHRGPREIGCSETFLKWLTDPTLNGGGALPDFGCYGADLITWLMAGQRPTSVFAVTQQIKPEVYPKVEDEATVVLTYPKAQGIIQASWNWPIDRKDMEIYGTTGYVLAPRKDLLRIRKVGRGRERTGIARAAPVESAPGSTLLPGLGGARRNSTLRPFLPRNQPHVTEILDAARESARTGRRIDLPAAPARAPVGIVWESFGTQSLCRSKGFEAALRYRLAKVLPMPGRCLRPRIHFHVAEHLGLGGDRLRAKCGSRAKFGNRAKFRNSSKCSSSRRTAAGQPGKRAILQRRGPRRVECLWLAARWWPPLRSPRPTAVWTRQSCEDCRCKYWFET
jgi:predicted dehydrogenase